MTPHIGLIPPTPPRRNYMTEQIHGLSIKEQAVFLSAVCKCGMFGCPENCPVDMMHDLETCPFPEKDCDEVKTWEWLPFLEKRVPPDDQGGGA